MAAALLPVLAGCCCLLPALAAEQGQDAASLIQFSEVDDEELFRNDAGAGKAVLDFLERRAAAKTEEVEGDLGGFLGSLRGPGKSFWDTLMETMTQPTGDWHRLTGSLMSHLPEGGKEFMEKQMRGTGAKPKDLLRLFPLAVMSLPALGQSGFVWQDNFHKFAKEAERRSAALNAEPCTSVNMLEERIAALQGELNGRYANFSTDMKEKMSYFGPLLYSARGLVPGLPDLPGARRLLTERFEGNTIMGGLLESGTYWTMAGDAVKIPIKLHEKNKALLETTLQPRELRAQQEERAERIIAFNRQLKSKLGFVSDMGTALLQFLDLYDGKFKQGMGFMGQPLYMVLSGCFQALRSIIQNGQRVMRAYAEGVHRATEDFGLDWEKPAYGRRAH